jgi:hypothetical protein
MNTTTWITPNLKAQIRNVFEPRYKRKLSHLEIIEIAENLAGVIETICQTEWKRKYEQSL